MNGGSSAADSALDSLARALAPKVAELVLAELQRRALEAADGEPDPTADVLAELGWEAAT